MTPFLYRILLIAVGIKNGILQSNIVLSLSKEIVPENTSAILTCSNTTESLTYSKWVTSMEEGLQGGCSPSNDTCNKAGFMTNNDLYDCICNDGTISLLLKNVDRYQHGATWKCEDIQSTSNTVVINVSVPVTHALLKKSSNREIYENATVKFTCNTSNSLPPALIRWYRSNGSSTVEMRNNTDSSVHLKRKRFKRDDNLIMVVETLSFRVSKSIHGWNVYCNVSSVNSHLVMSNKISLSVNFPPDRPPEIHQFLKGSTYKVIETKLATLSCSVEGGNPLGKPKWLCKNIINTTSTEINKDNRTVTTSLTWTAKRDQGKTCICQTDHWLSNEFVFVNIDVLYPPDVPAIQFQYDNDTKNVTIEAKLIENKSYRISCSADGNPVPKIYFWSGPQIMQKTMNGTIYVLTVQKRDIGTYSCKAQNIMEPTYGKNQTAQNKTSIHVDVLYKPTIASLDNQNIVEGSPLDITCRASSANPKKTQVIWTRDQHDWTINSSALILPNISRHDSMNYTCTIKNNMTPTVGPAEEGSDSATFYLNVLSVETTVAAAAVEEFPIGVVVGSIAGVIAITIVIVFGIILYRKRGTLSHRKQSETGRPIYQNIPFSDISGRNLTIPVRAEGQSSEETSFHGLQELDDASPLINEPTEYYNSPEKIEQIKRIRVSELLAYASGRSEESFGIDVQKLTTGLQHPCAFARRPENIALNRYNGIYPYDYSRVKISGQPDFFINACYIDGYRKTNAYVASLGPTGKTTYDFKTFWMMVWNEQSDIIVMLTNLTEPSGMKCEQYWPNLGSRILYGDIQVLCEREDVFAEYTTRFITISKADNRRRITHLHYTAWPDKKVPEDVTTLIEFRERLKETRSSKSGPIVVHCSAGIGRTGTLIALDRLIEEGQCEFSVDVFKCVNSMREQRVKMVQTLEQYIYIYKALVNSLYFDCEMIPLETFQEYLDETNNNIYSTQFQQLKESVETCQKVESDARSANKKLVHKNRHGSDIPGSQHRVYLYINRKIDDTDYINAVYINSFKKKDHFITAQSPLPDTVSDFLCMIYQEECCCVITMEDLKDPGMNVGQFLPSDGRTLKYGDMNISCTTLETKPQYTVSEMRIKNSVKHAGGEKAVYHFQYNKWMPGHDTPQGAKEFVQFVKDVEDYADQLGEETSHVLVHCLKANERSALYCVVTILMEKMRYERQVSVLNTVRHLRTRRRSAITSMEQLKFCYQAVSAYISLFEP